MTNWNKHYQENTVTAEEAITYIHSGDTVVFSHAAVEPTHIIRTLLAHADRRNHPYDRCGRSGILSSGI